MRRQVFVVLALGVLIPTLVLARPLGDQDQPKKDDPETQDVPLPEEIDAMTGMPGMTGMPEMTGMPGMSGMPEMTGMPGMSHMPEMTGMPCMPGMPGMPCEPGMTAMPEMDMGMKMLGSCIGLGIIAMLYEGFKVAREVISRKKQTRRRSRPGPDGGLTGPQHSNGVTYKGSWTKMAAEYQNNGFVGNTNNHNNIGYDDDDDYDDGCCGTGKMCNGWHWLQTLLHVIQVFVSYCLMLVFMTYNAWLCIAVCVGAGVGYFFFGSMKHNINDPNEHCH